MKKEEFVWKAGVQFPVSAECAANVIRDLQRSLDKDTITAKELLDASRDEDAPLHKCFEWDDNIAAEKYRVYQARHIINSVEIRYVDVETPPHLSRSRYFINVVPVTPKTQGQFATIDIAFSNDNYRNAVLKDALRELRAFQIKYSRYQELSDIFKAIDAFGDSLK